MMKKLTILIAMVAASGLAAADELSAVLQKDIPNVKKVSADVYRRLHAGFEFKGYQKSPGHQAVLNEMRNYYQLLKKFDEASKDAKTFPSSEYDLVKTSLACLRLFHYY